MPESRDPTSYHRRCRDKWVRQLMGGGQKLFPLLRQGKRASAAQLAELRHQHAEALYHAREVLRVRSLEWPTSRSQPIDQEILDFLEELQHWITLISCVGSNREGFLIPLVELFERRVQSRMHLTHRMPHLPAIY